MRTVAVIYAEAADPAGHVLLAPLVGRPVAEHAVAAFRAAPGVDDVLLVTAPALAGPLRAALDGLPPRIVRADGPRPRAVYQAVEAFAEVVEAFAEASVLIHDARWPLVSPRVIADCIAALRDNQAVCAAVPASDTMVAVEKDLITERPPRDRLRRRQYPQGFRSEVIRRACRLALADSSPPPTDECGLVLRYLPEVPVALVAGSERNFPVTGPLDLEIAEALLAAGLA